MNSDDGEQSSGCGGHKKSVAELAAELNDKIIKSSAGRECSPGGSRPPVPPKPGAVTAPNDSSPGRPPIAPKPQWTKSPSQDMEERRKSWLRVESTERIDELLEDIRLEDNARPLRERQNSLFPDSPDDSSDDEVRRRSQDLCASDLSTPRLSRDSTKTLTLEGVSSSPPGAEANFDYLSLGRKESQIFRNILNEMLEKQLHKGSVVDSGPPRRPFPLSHSMRNGDVQETPKQTPVAVLPTNTAYKIPATLGTLREVGKSRRRGRISEEGHRKPERPRKRVSAPSLNSRFSLSPVRIVRSPSDSQITSDSGYFGSSCFDTDSFCSSRSCESYTFTVPNTSSASDPEQKRKTKLHRVADEIYTTESSYIKKLNILSDTFPNYISTCGDVLQRQLYGTAVVETLQKYLLQIVPTHVQIKEELGKQMAKWDDEEPDLMRALLIFAPMLKVCGTFLTQKNKLVSDLVEAKERSTEFSKALREFEISYLSGLRLPDELDCVHQRVCRYPLLISSYIKYLPETSPEYQRALEAQEKTQKVAESLEKHLADGDSTKSLWDIHCRLQGRFDVFVPGRRIIKQGPVDKHSRKDVQHRFLILFSDVLLYCRSVPGTDYLVIGQALYLDSPKHFRVEVPEHEDYKLQFFIHSKQRSLTMVAKDVVERKLWVKAIHQALSERFGGELSFETVEPGLGAPRWIPDKEVTMCQSCSRQFTAVRRRHHCRACGRVICDDCEGKAPLYYMDLSPGKVCPDCFLIIQQEVVSSKLLHRARNEGKSWCEETTVGTLQLLLRCPPRLLREKTERAEQNGEEEGEEDVEVGTEAETDELSGFLERLVKRAWRRVWVQLQNGMLFFFYAPKDKVNCGQLMLLGCEMKVEDKDDSTIIHLAHVNQFKTADSRHISETLRLSAAQAERWIGALREYTEIR